MATGAFRAAAKSTLTGVAIALCCAVPAGAHYDFGWGFSTVDGDPSVHSVEGALDDDFEVKYDFATQRCAASDPLYEPPYNTYERPDEAPRVFRFNQSDGTTPRLQMNLAISMRNARWIGTTLDDLQREHLLAPPEYRQCAPDNTPAGRAADEIAVYRSPRPIPTFGAPWNFQQNEWLTSPYYVGGTNPAVYALIHHEFHGTAYQKATFCPPGYVFEDCWMGSITLAKSVAADQSQNIPNRLGSSYGNAGVGGVSGQGGFRGGKDTLVATLPTQYFAGWGYRGYQNFTNIVKHSDDYYYIIASMLPAAADPDGINQDSGKCVLRTANLNDASSWRGWDGQGWNTLYRSPYQDPFPNGMLSPAQKQEQICKPLAVHFAARSLTYNVNLGKYMLMGTSGDASAGAGIYYVLSDDLINWSDRQLLLAHPEVVGECPLEDQHRYPVILDPDDAASVADPSVATANTNFDHPDRTAYLYTTRASCPNNSNPKGKDLVRTPIKFMQRSASLEPPIGPTDAWPSVPQNDYDSTTPTWFNKFNTGDSYGAASDGWSAIATSWPFQNIRAAHGQHTVRWNTGDDVWYGSAFKIPTDFVASNAGVQIMSWHTGTAGVYGGIALGTDDQWHMVRGGPGGSYIGQPFDLPTGRWTWVEVHQRLGTSSGAGTLTEVFADGRLVSTTDAANRADSAPITNVRYGIVWNNTPIPQASPSTQILEVDRSSLSGGQLGALGGSQSYRAPATPLGLRTSPDDTSHIRLKWNEVPSVAGYRIYEQQGDGTWAAVGGPVTGDSHLLSVSECSSHTYRITAYRDHGADPIDWAESVVSTPLVAQPDGCS